MQAVPKIICRGGHQPFKVEEFCKYAIGLLKVLGKVDPCLKSWGLARPSTQFSVVEKLNDDFSNVEDILCDEFKIQSEKHPSDFLYSEGESSFTKEAVSVIGLRANFYSLPGNHETFDWSNPHFKLILNAGADSWDNFLNCILEFPNDSDCGELDWVFVKKSFCEIVSYTNAKFAFFETMEFKRKVQQKINYNKCIKLAHELQVSRNISIGPLLYIKYPICGSLNANVKCEEYKGGSLISVSDNVYDSSEQAVDRGVEYYNEMLDKYLFTSHYTFLELFLSPKELAYKQQVTGQLGDYKHQLGHVFFDAYDKERDVLMHATLFQVPQDSRSQTAEQFFKYAELKREIVSIAKRQISVVANSRNKIEWHIGMEPQVDLVVKIFDEEGIDKDKIAVKYTPFNDAIFQG